MGQSFSIGAIFPFWFRLWLGEKLFSPVGSNTTRLSWHRVVKGPCHPPEIEALRYIASHTTIPSPRVHATHIHNGLIYAELEYIRGKSLQSAWRHLSTDEKSTIFADIKQCVTRLRELEPPAQDIVCSAFQNPAYDCRIGFRYFGPMNHAEFHSLARMHLLMEEVQAGVLGPELAKVHTGKYRTCFTHGDLAPRNIIVRRGRVAAIIDWEFAGWYPEYWELTRAHYNYVSEEWDDYLAVALPSYDVELKAERTLWRRLPDPGSAFQGTLQDGHTFQNEGSNPSEAWLAARAGRQTKDLWSVAMPLPWYRPLFPPPPGGAAARTTSL